MDTPELLIVKEEEEIKKEKKNCHVSATPD